MAKFSRRRPVVVTTVMLLLLGGAFSMYYFFYVPRNKQQVQQYGFNTLRSISETLESRNNDQLKFSYNNISKDTTGTTLQLPATSSWDFINKTDESAAALRGTEGNAALLIKNDSLYYYTKKMDTRKESYRAISFSINDLMQPIVKDRSEFFTGYLLIKPQGDTLRQTVFDNSRLGEDLGNILDTLLAKNKGHQISSIYAIHVQGKSYMVFTYPIKFGKEKLLLCGLLPARVFNARVNYIPDSFLYGVVIVLIIILISLPFVKLYLMGKEERLGFSDLVLTIAALFVGVTMVTLVIIHWLLLEGSYARTRDDLKYLSDRIDTSYQREKDSIREQLITLDAAMDNRLKKIADTAAGDTALYDNIFIYESDRRSSTGKMLFDTRTYSYFDRVVWADFTGQQKIKGERKGDNKPIFINIRERQYYRVFDTLIKLYGNPLKGAENEIYIEPINSWTSGEFRIDVSMKSRIPQFNIVVMVTEMYSFINTIVPEGYGFCLLDKNGSVQVHSSKGRNLTGNLLEEINSNSIREAINGRQNKYVKTLLYNGKPYSMYIRPLENSDLFLVTFHDSSYMLPVNLRILVFALLFSFITCILVMGAIVALKYRGLNAFQSMADYFSWLVPRLHLKGFYIRGIVLFIGYMFVFLLLQFKLPPTSAQYAVLIWGILSPLNLIFMLFWLYVKHYKIESMTARLKIYRALIVWGAWLLATLLAYLIFAVNDCHSKWIYWLLPFIIIGATIIIMVIPAKDRKEEDLPILDILKKCFTRYKFFILFLLLAFSALPVSTFTWFAHNIEILQEVKKQQLHEINALAERQFRVAELWNLGGSDSALNKEYVKLQYENGRYAIYPDSVILLQEDTGKAKPLPDHVILHFYFGLADMIGAEYYAPISYPGFDHAAADRSWEWEFQRNDSFLLMKDYHHHDFNLRRLGLGNGSIALLSKYPDRFKFIDTVKGLFFLFVFIGLVGFVLYQLIRQSCNALFHLKVIQLFAVKETIDTVANKKELKDIVKELMDETVVKGFDEKLWGKETPLTPLHKLLLLDMAVDGLINSGNLPEIGQLIKMNILCIRDGRLKFADDTFRAYLLSQKNTIHEVELRKEIKSESTWELLHLPVIIAITAIAIFIFFTQEDVFRQIAAAVAAASTLIPALPKLFGGGNSAAGKEAGK